MRIEIIASGSKGNCYIIEDSETTIMIEAGISPKEFRKISETKISDIDYCISSHIHQDHSKYIQQFMDKAIDFWVNDNMHGLFSGHRLHCYHALEEFSLGTFKIFPFPVNHDVPNYGFIIRSENGEKVVFATDTYYLDYNFVDVDYYMIESSYEASILRANLDNGMVVPEYAERLKKSHFELENLKEFFRKTCTKKTKQIYLLHLSEQNSDATLFADEIKKITGKPVIACN